MVRILTSILEPSPKLRLIFELTCYVLYVILTLGQLGTLDYYMAYYADNAWLGWIAADAVVLCVMLWVLVIAVRYNYSFVHRGGAADDANLRFAFLVWLVYSLTLSAKIVVIRYKVMDKSSLIMICKMSPMDDGCEHQVLNLNAFRLLLALSAVVFLLLVLSHHYTHLHSPRQELLSYMTSNVTLDILDSIQFLNMLFEPTLTDKTSDALEAVILFFVCWNFFMPTFALLRLRYNTLPRWFPFGYQEVYTMLYKVLVNVPYLIIRSFLFHDYDNDISTFMVKNVIMVLLAIRDIWLAYLKNRHVNDVATARDPKDVPLAEQGSDVGHDA